MIGPTRRSATRARLTSPGTRAPDDGDLLTHYCRLPRGATACEADVVLPIPRRAGSTFSSLDGPHVFATGERIVVATYRNGSFDRPDGIGDRALFAFVSTDDGRTFGPAAIVGTQSPSGDAILGPGDLVMAISNAETGGTFFQSASLTGFASAVANLGDGPAQWYNGSVASVGGATVAAFDDLSTVFFRSYAGAGDMNSAASWTPTASLGAGTDTRLAGGPGGIYLMAKTGASSKKRYVVRRFDGAGFGRATTLSKKGDPIFNDLAQDGGGRLHAVWLNGSRALIGRASDGTSFWGPRRELVPSSVSIFDPEIAVGSDGRGVAVWRGGGVYAIRLNPACANRVVGTARADTLRATTRGDHVLGLRGGDTVRGRAGDDCIDGGAGADRLFGQAGDDELAAGAGRDRADGGAGDDTIDGGAGPDTLIGEPAPTCCAAGPATTCSSADAVPTFSTAAPAATSHVLEPEIAPSGASALSASDAHRGRESLNELGRVCIVGRVLAAVDPDERPIGVDDRGAPELEGVFARSPELPLPDESGVRLPGRERQEDRALGAAHHAVASVKAPLGIGEERQREPELALQEPEKLNGARHDGDGLHLGERRERPLHLAEVDLAGQSVDVARHQDEERCAEVVGARVHLPARVG